jgi:hypothetical protein
MDYFAQCNIKKGQELVVKSVKQKDEGQKKNDGLESEKNWMEMRDRYFRNMPGCTRRTRCSVTTRRVASNRHPSWRHPTLMALMIGW